MASRYKPLETLEDWERLVQASKNIQVLGRLTDAEAQRSLEAADTLRNVQQTSTKWKHYKEFLYDVLNHSGPAFVLLCAVAHGKVKGGDMKASDRLGLVREIKANKDDNNISHPSIRSLALDCQIPDSVTDLPRLLHTVVERCRKRNRISLDSQYPEQALESTARPTGDVYRLEPVNAPNVLPESTPGLNSDAYPLTPMDILAVIADVQGQMCLIDPYDDAEIIHYSVVHLKSFNISNSLEIY